MCNTFLCTTGLARGLNYKLILLNNRDEVLDRKTSAAHWENNYLAGHDEQEKERGTWLGIRKDGRIGNTLSITEPEHIKDQRPLAPTRGTIVTDFLKTGALSAVQYCSDFTKKALNYNGFQFLALERNESDHYNVYSLTNRLVKEVKTCSWKEGMATNTTQTIYILISLVTLATANLLLQPVEQLDKDAWCGPFRECPSGTQCMKLIDRSEPFSCFLPRYGSIVSFIEHHERMIEPRPAKSHHYEPLPIWLLASSSFGILCAASIVIWASFYVTRSLILCILRAKCKQADQKAKAESVNQAFRRESNDPNDV